MCFTWVLLEILEGLRNHVRKRIQKELTKSTTEEILGGREQKIDYQLVPWCLLSKIQWRVAKAKPDIRNLQCRWVLIK